MKRPFIFVVMGMVLLPTVLYEVGVPAFVALSIAILEIPLAYFAGREDEAR